MLASCLVHGGSVAIIETEIAPQRQQWQPWRPTQWLSKACPLYVPLACVWQELAIRAANF